MSDAHPDETVFYVSIAVLHENLAEQPLDELLLEAKYAFERTWPDLEANIGEAARVAREAKR